jgi:hypothetical protein
VRTQRHRCVVCMSCPVRTVLAMSLCPSHDSAREEEALGPPRKRRRPCLGHPYALGLCSATSERARPTPAKARAASNSDRTRWRLDRDQTQWHEHGGGKQRQERRRERKKSVLVVSIDMNMPGQWHGAAAEMHGEAIAGRERERQGRR